MTEYEVPCECGESVWVGLHKCGLDVACPRCTRQISIPDSKTLMASCGDSGYGLRPIEIIRELITHSLSPFDRRCLMCDTHATHVVDIQLWEHENISENEEERTGSTFIPFYFCEMHADEFERARPGLWWKILIVGGLSATVFELVFRFWPATIIATLLLLWNFFRLMKKEMGTYSGPPKWVAPWIAKIPWFPEAILESSNDSEKTLVLVGPMERL